MLIGEHITHCAKCEENTPHSRDLAVLQVLAVCVLFALGGAALIVAEWPVLGGVMMYAALVAGVRSHARRDHSRCERCRGKARARLARQGPTFDGMTETQLF